MDQKPIFVTGASGVLGRSIVQALAEAKLMVRRGLRNPAALAGNDAVHFDYNVPGTFEPALRDARGLLLMAPPLDLEAPSKLKPVIDRANNAGIGRVVLISAFGVNFNEQAPLRIVERHVMESKIPYAIVRPNFFMENFSEGFLAGTIKAQNGIFLAAGDGRTSFISVSDIAAAVVKCFTDQAGNRELDLTGPEALSHSEVAVLISRVSSRPVAYHSLTEDAMVAGARSMGMPETAIGYMTALYAAVRAGHAAAVTSDFEKVTGHKPIAFGTFAEKKAAIWK